MAGSYILKDGALAGEAVPRFLVSPDTLATYRVPGELWGEPDGGYEGSPDPRPAAPTWSARINTTAAEFSLTRFKCLMGIGVGGGNTSVAELFVTVTLDQVAGNTLEVYGRYAPGYQFDGSGGDASRTFSHALGQPLLIQYQSGDTSVLTEDGTVLVTLPWSEAVSSLTGTYLGEPVVFNPASTYPWVFMSILGVDGSYTPSLRDVYYGGLPEGGAPSAFWTRLVGARETP